MACCALAVFLIGQVYGVITAIRSRFGIGHAPGSRNASSAWRPGMPPVGAAARTYPRFRPATLIYFASFGALTVAIIGFTQITPEERAAHIRAMLADPIHWCGHKLDV